MTKFSKFLKDESGATAIEYGLIAALIAVAIIAAVTLVGGSLTNTFTGISTQLNSASGGGTTTPVEEEEEEVVTP